MLASRSTGSPWSVERLARSAARIRSATARGVLVVGRREQDGELVAAEAGDHVARAERRSQRGRRPPQQPSPMGWPSVSLTSLNRSRSRWKIANDSSLRLCQHDRLVQPVTKQRPGSAVP